MGLRLRRADGADAVHRVVLRPAARRPVPAVLRTRAPVEPPAGLFPGAVAFSTTTADPCRERLVYRPLFARAARARPLRWVQQGRVQLYLLYVLATLLVLLFWK